MFKSAHHTDRRCRTSSMYEVFNWGHTNDEPPKRFSLSIVGSEIDIDGPPQPQAQFNSIATTSATNKNKNTLTNISSEHNNNSHPNSHLPKQYSNHNFYSSITKGEDAVNQFLFYCILSLCFLF